MLSVKCYLKAKRKKNMKKHFKNMKKHKNLAGFVTFYFALCLIFVCSNILKTYEMLSTHDLCMRNTDPRFQLVWCCEKHFQMKNAVFPRLQHSLCQYEMLSPIEKSQYPIL